MKKIVRAVVATAALAAGLLSVPTTAHAAGTPYLPGTLRPSVSQATQDQVRAHEGGKRVWVQLPPCP